MKNLTKTFGIFISIIGLLTTTCDNGNSIHSHEWSDWTLQSGATCTSAEVQERSCSCGETETQNIGDPDPNAHSLQAAANATPATCEVDGFGAAECVRCDYTQAGGVIQKLGHD